MRKATIAATTLLLLTACTDGTATTTEDGRPGAAQAAPASRSAAEAGAPSGITVVGEGRATATPDRVRATVGVEVTRESVDEALAVANERARAVIDAVMGQGVPEQDIRTRDVSLRPRSVERPEPREQPGPRPEFEGYVASNTVEIEIGDVDGAGDVLQAAVDAGGDATRIDGLSFSLEDDQALREAAREQAFEAARTTASQYASLSDRTLGELVAVTEQTTARSPVPTEDAAGGPPVEPGRQEVVVRVEARWALK